MGLRGRGLRRPHGPPTDIQKMEGLMQYHSHLPLIPTQIVSYNISVRSSNRCPASRTSRALTVPLYSRFCPSLLPSCAQIANVRSICSSPSALESTSLVLAYGLDLFYVRVAPSKTFDLLAADFNHPLLVVLISALAFAMTFAQQLMKRKVLGQRWA